MAPQHAVQTPDSRPPVLRLYHSAVLMNLLFLFISFSSFAAPNQTISLSVTNAPLEKVFKEIQKQSGYTFVYTREVLAQAKPVTVKLSNVRVEEALAECLKEQPVTYSVVDRMVIIKPRKVERAVQMSEATAGEPVTVSGRVTDEKGNPLAGATVKVKGSLIGTTTDKDGKFTLVNVDGGAMLEISYVGHETQTVTVRGKSLISIVLGQKLSMLDETVVIAYGTTTRRLNTGNVSTVKAEDIGKQPVQNPLLALQGRVPGVTIEQATGMPGAGIKIRIQGGTSLSNGNEPLYVVDGVPYPQSMSNSLSGIQGSSQRLGQNPGNPITYINPADIESIDILKDADATAIYGSRAANGAILITTKKGKAGKSKIDINFQKGWSKVGHFIKLLKTEQYLEMRNEAYFINDGLTKSSTQYATQYDINGTWDTTRYTDWQKTLIGGTANYTDAVLSVSGGTSNTNFRIGGGYNKVTTVFPDDFGDKRSSIHLNINHASTDQRFHLQVTGSYLSNKNNLLYSDLTRSAIELPPNAPDLYNTDGSLNWALNASGASSTWSNPLAYTKQAFNQSISNLTGNAIISYNIIHGLSIKTNFGFNMLNRNEISKFPMDSNAPERRVTTTRTSLFNNAKNSSWIVEPQLTYQTKIDKGQLEFLIGGTFLENESYVQGIQASGFSSDLLMEDILSATNITPQTSSGNKYRYNALFSRLNYNWQNKYLINLTVRRDGSSRFGSENLFNNFGSGACAWIFSNEKNIQKTLRFLSFGKLRASYGTTGNDQIGDYRFLNIYFSSGSSSPAPYQGQTGLAIFGISNPFLQWEETKKLQLGLDLGFLKDRILLGLNYYRNRSSNQLQRYGLPLITGVSSITINFPATLENSGWEIYINTNNIRQRNFTWNSSFNLTIPKNKLVEYKDLDKSTLVNTYVIGQPITLVKQYDYLGVDPSTGLFLFQTSDGNTTNNPVSSKDAISWFNSASKLYGGIQNNLQLGGISLDFLFQFVKQMGTDYRFGNQPGLFAGTNTAARGNQPVTVMDRWQKSGDQTFFQRFSATYPSSINNPYNSVRASDAAFLDISYIRLKNVSLSWHLSDIWNHKKYVQDVRLFAQGQNLWTITNYVGLDPESGTYSLPPLRTWTLGMQVIF
jgi:TonB-dependent starch-binding outer membrane protein SusC